MSSHRPKRGRAVVLALAALVVAVVAVLVLRDPAVESSAASPSSSAAPVSTSAEAPTTDAGVPGGSGTSAPGSATGATTSGSPAGNSPDTGGRGPEDVTVSTTYVGWDAGSSSVLVAGFVSGVIEDGGTCTVTLTRRDAVLTATAEGLADATTTSCGQLAVDGASAGDWNVVLSYRSPTSTGSSASASVEVP